MRKRARIGPKSIGPRGGSIRRILVNSGSVMVRIQLRRGAYRSISTQGENQRKRIAIMYKVSILYTILTNR